jgi:aspartate kinase
MKIIVQKFGGTSVSTEERRKFIIQKINNAIEKGYSPVVVVSAMGRRGEPYATDSLLSLISEKFKEENLKAVDLLMSCGEIISTVVMCDELFKINVAAEPLTGGQAGIITDSSYSNAKLKKVNNEMILKLLEMKKVPVVAGFQGIDENGFMTTIGRGGSDVTAAVLGAALKAERVEIYTDVDGIMTCDPRIVPDASLIENIGYDEIFQFADQGAKVIHPRAVEIARKYDIPLLIKNTMSDSKGTLINRTDYSMQEKVVSGITSMKDRVQVKVSYKNNDNYFKLFKVLAENNISVDLINVFPKEKIFTIDKKDLEKFHTIVQSLKLECVYTDNCSKIAIIGAGMKGRPGVMARILIALTRENIDVLQTADSHMTIWCLVKSSDEVEAINALHKEFEL